MDHILDQNLIGLGLMSKRINQIEPFIDKSDISSVTKYLNSGGWLTEHTETRTFENNIKNFTNRKYASTVPNGTIAIYVALIALGIKKGDKVAVPNLTMIATINAVIWLGAIPILIDTDDFLCMSYEKLKKIKGLDAVIFVPLNGRGGSGEAIERWCKKNNILLIEDSAHALSSNYKNKNCVKLGDISTLSFTPHKIITMGQGGMVLTDNKNIYKHIEALKSFNRSQDKSDFHKGFGLNFKITDLQASIGNSQFKKIETFRNKKVKLSKTYKQYIPEEITMINFEEFETPWFIDLIFESKLKLNQAKKILESNNIETRLCYPPLSKQKYLKKYSHNDLKNSENLSDKILWMPSSVSLAQKDVKSIISLIS